jgi:predicted acylesterase/phospholipase RssA
VKLEYQRFRGTDAADLRRRKRDTGCPKKGYSMNCQKVTPQPPLPAIRPVLSLLKGAFLAAAACLLSLAGGCGPRPDSPFAGLDTNRARLLSARIGEAREELLREDLRGAFGGARPQNVLALSGGDADGAFGCGVLHGWRHAPGCPRPTFDVVTGVSTGALIATFAFLGEERDDQTLRNVYTTVRDKDIYVGPFTPGPPNSVFDTGPLQQLIARHVTAEVLARVAAAHREGRRLYVATVELESGRLVIWPMSRLAADAMADQTPGAAEAGLQRFRTILLAAASIPVFFPPVEIDKGLHVDAGLLEAIFLRPVMLGEPGGGDSVVSLSNGPGPASPTACPAAHYTVYAIVNGKLRPNPQAVGNELFHIGGRSLDIYTDALQLFNVREIADVAWSNDPPFQFRYISIPDGVDDSPGPSLLPRMFDPAVMTRRYEAGEALGRQTPESWDQEPPKLDNDP